MYRQPPQLPYSGLTVILSRPSRFDQQTGKLLSGFAGQVFKRYLHPLTAESVDFQVATETVELLPQTRLVLLLGDEALSKFYPVDKPMSLNDARGNPLVNKINNIVYLCSFGPQDAQDLADYESGSDDESEAEGDDDVKGHGVTKRRNWSWWLRKDVAKAQRLLKMTVAEIEEPSDIRIYPPADEVCQHLKSISNDRLILDIETKKRNEMTCIGLSFASSNIVYVIPWSRYNNTYAYGDIFLRRIIQALCVAMGRNTVVCHNASYDLLVLCWKYKIPIPKSILDTMLLWHRCTPGYEMVDTLDGQIPIKDLVGKSDVWVWSYKNGNPVPAKAKNIRLVGTNESLVRVHFWRRTFPGIAKDYIDCTPDHKFLLLDGNWVEAKDLIRGNSLTKINFQQSEYLSLDVDKQSIKAHRYVYEYINKLKIDGNDIHHIDENPLNNNPSNLKLVSRLEHNLLHNKHLNLDRTGKTKTVKTNYSISNTDKLIELYNSGMSQKDLAFEFRVHQSVISRALKNLNVNRRTLSESQKLRRQNNINCKIISVEHLLNKEDVYCMEVEDTQCYSCKGVIIHNCYPELEKSLGHLISYFLNRSYHKSEGVYSPQTPQQEIQLFNYNAKDIITTKLILQPLLDEAKLLGAAESAAWACRMVRPYLTATLRGLRTDVDEFKARFSALEIKRQQINRCLGVITKRPEMNVRSHQQVSEYLYKSLSLHCPDEKKPTAAKTLLRLLCKNKVPSIKLILLSKKTGKLASSMKFRLWKDMTTGQFTRYTCVYNIAGTDSFRLGSRAAFRYKRGDDEAKLGYGTNLQNQKKEQRQLIKADIGYKLGQRDQSGAEALVVAYLCRHGKFRELFLHGVKPHVFVALHVFADKWRTRISNPSVIDVLLTLSPADLKLHPAFKELDGIIKDSDNWQASERYYFIAKMICHASNYGMKFPTFQINVLEKSEGAVELSTADCRKFLEYYHKLFPEIEDWHRRTQQQLLATRTLKNLFGEPRIFNGHFDDNTFKSAYAFVPQSTVGQITNYAYSELQELCDQGGTEQHPVGVWGFHPLQNNHDSILYQNYPQFEKAAGDLVGLHLAREMISPIDGTRFRMKTELQVGYNWCPFKKIINPEGLIEVK